VNSFAGLNEYNIRHGGSAEIACLPASTDEAMEEKLSIYPNPAKDILTIEYKGPSLKYYSYELLHTDGQKIKTGVLKIL